MERKQQNFHALGSQVFITLIADSNFSFDKYFNLLHDKIAAFEQRFSRFLPDSELTKFNENAGDSIIVSPEFKALLLSSQRMAEATNDVYNPFVLPALQQAGYKGSWPSPDKLEGAKDFSSRQVVSSDELKIIKNRAKIPSNTAIDFGGIGKGYLLDELDEFLKALQLYGYWISLGGDIVCAGRDLGGDWSIQVQHANQLDKPVVTLEHKLSSSLFIATSGVTKRKGNNWHHIINPKTGQPSTSDILTATVTAVSGVEADVYAKAIVVIGSKEAYRLKEIGRIKSFVLQYENKEADINL